MIKFTRRKKPVTYHAVFVTNNGRYQHDRITEFPDEKSAPSFVEWSSEQRKNILSNAGIENCVMVFSNKIQGIKK